MSFDGQLAFSPGYSNQCAGTPAEGSDWMWPLAWSAHVTHKTMRYGSDEVQYEAQSKVALGLSECSSSVPLRERGPQVFYRLDKNWKRSDTLSQNGTLRTVGQGPCESKAEDPYSCTPNRIPGLFFLSS